MPLHLIRNLCMFGLPLILAVTALLHFQPFGLSWPQVAWSQAFYTIALTANIGYFTNFIAIKMLFKPHQRTAFGRQGLIPKNQPRLARALADTLSDHFLAGEHWEEYLAETGISDKLVDATEGYCRKWIRQPAHSEKLFNSIAELIEANRDSIQPVFDKMMTDLVPKLSARIDPEVLLKQGFDWIEDQFERHPQKMEFLIEPVIKTVAENVPLIAERIIDTVDDHIEKQDTFRRNVAKAARWSANIQEEDIREYLFRMVASPEFRGTLLKGLQSLLSKYKTAGVDAEGLSPGIHLTRIIQKLVHQQTEKFDLAHFVASKLRDSQNQRKLRVLLKRSQAPFFEWLRNQLATPEMSHKINGQLVKLIENLDLREIIQDKAAKFSPAKMEFIFHNMISDQLVFIELLGALLGALSGLALVDLTSFAGLTATLVAFFGLDLLFTRWRDKRNPGQESQIVDE